MRSSPFLHGGRLGLLLLASCLSACAPAVPNDQEQQAQIREVFASFKADLFSGHAKQALAYLDRDSLNYFQTAATKSPAPGAKDAQIQYLLHRVLEKITPGGIKPGFTLDVPVQRILDAGWLTTRDLDHIELGPVKITGGQAQTEILWEGSHTTFQLFFLRQDGWKIDIITMLPYAELALQSDRAIRRETDAQQLDRLVSQVPVP